MTDSLFIRTRPGFLISSDPNLLSLDAISAAFASSQMYWCKSLSIATLQKCLSNSFNLGLYIDPTPPSGAAGLASPPKPIQIGLARLITDHVTIAYLTDVYVVDEEQGKGLGKWLINCVDELLKEMGDLRRALLLTGEGGLEAFYERELGMKRFDSSENGLIIMNRNGPGVMLKGPKHRGVIG